MIPNRRGRSLSLHLGGGNQIPFPHLLSLGFWLLGASRLGVHLTPACSVSGAPHNPIWLEMPALARSLSRSRSRWRFSPHCSLRPSLEAIPLRRHDCSRAAPLSICRVLIPTPRCRTFWSGNVRHVRSSSSSLASASSSSSSSADSESSSSDEVKIRFGKQNASAPSGTLLRSAMLMNGLSPHNEGARTINCRGLGTW